MDRTKVNETERKKCPSLCNKTAENDSSTAELRPIPLENSNEGFTLKFVSIKVTKTF